jgi:hypothetical protein
MLQLHGIDTFAGHAPCGARSTKGTAFRGSVRQLGAPEINEAG